MSKSKNKPIIISLMDFIIKSCDSSNATTPIFPWGGGGGGGDLLMLGIRVCATDQGRFFTSNNPEQALLFEVLFRIFFWQSGLKRPGSNVKNPSCFPQSDRSNPNFLFKKYAYILVKDTECVPVIIIISKFYSNKLMLPVKAFVSCSLMFSFLFCHTWAKCLELSITGISFSQDICIPLWI